MCAGSEYRLLCQKYAGVNRSDAPFVLQHSSKLFLQH